MANRNSEEREVRKIIEVGDSLGVTLPIELVRDLGWREGQKVTVKQWGDGKLLIEDWED